MKKMFVKKKNSLIVLETLKRKLTMTTRTRGTIDSQGGPLQWLHGHTSTITCVDGNVDLGIVVSGSEAGTCLIHDVYTGAFLVSLDVTSSSSSSSSSSPSTLLPKDSSIHVVRLINNTSRVVVVTSDSICIFSSSTGKLLRRAAHLSLSTPHNVDGEFFCFCFLFFFVIFVFSFFRFFFDFRQKSQNS